MNAALPRRHLLVVAPQCRSMEHLDRLKGAATELQAVLLDHQLGACNGGLRDRRSLLTGQELSIDVIRHRVREAIEYAAEERAHLVLALLGHGFVPGDTATLYLMGADSTYGRTESGVNVGELLTGAVNHLTIPSVLGIIDTCHATAALPPLHDLTVGTANGLGRLAVLMGSAVHEEGVDLAFSRSLTEAIRAGEWGGGPLLGVDWGKKAVRARGIGQRITGFELDADGRPAAALWIARNAAHHRVRPGGLTGPLAHERLSATLGALDPGEPQDRLPYDEKSARERLAELEALPRGLRQLAAIRAVDAVLVAVQSVTFIRSWLGTDLTTALVNRALHTLLAREHRLPAEVLEHSEVEAVDRVVFDRPRADDDCRGSLTRFVVLLAQNAGRDLRDPELTRWGHRIDAQRELNDAVTKAAGVEHERRLRLVVSLHSSLTGDWPGDIGAWLLQDGKTLVKAEFECLSPDMMGTELALRKALVWAETHAEVHGLDLKRIDVAAPGKLLLEWRPEEAGVVQKLGVDYDVVLHWSRRLTPDVVLKEIEPRIRDRAKKIAACAHGVPVDWLEPKDTEERDVLGHQLENGRYRQAIGLTHPHGVDDGLLETLLVHTPVLLWPHSTGTFPRERHGSLEANWRDMPEALVRSYQHGWLNQDVQDFAVLRAVWDDYEWLRFCLLYRTEIPPAQTPDEDDR